MSVPAAWKIGRIAALAVLGLCGGGCKELLYLMAPPEKSKVQYKLNSAGRLAIILDDEWVRIDYPRAKAKLVDGIGRRLSEHKAVASATRYKDQSSLMFRQAQYNRLKPEQIGKLLHADQVLYLEVVQFRLKDHPGDTVYRGRIEIEASVIDTKSGKTLWESSEPIVQTHPLVVVRDAFRQPERITEMMADKIADTIAKLFYEYELSVTPEYEGPS